jgi:hypothetical protein
MTLKDIPGYEKQYAITIDGRVWSYPKQINIPPNRIGIKKGRWLSHVKSRDDRATVSLAPNNKRFYVHRLIAMTYIHKPAGKDHVNHIDGNRFNNHVSNLEWCTQAENNKHGWKIGSFKYKIPLKDIEKIRERRKNGTRVVDLAKEYGVGISAIYRLGR